MSATPEQVAWLERVQEAVNTDPYIVNVDADAHDIWVDTPLAGEGFECRDFTLAKAKMLRDQGWPVDDMSIVLCNDELGDYHAVLACKAGGDIYILDNRTPSVYLWDHPVYPYKWLHQQISGTTEFRDASAGLV